MNCNGLIIKWMNNIYTLEISSSRAYEAYVEDAENMPQVEAMFNTFIEKISDRADRIKNRIEELGGDISKVKEGMADISGMLKGAIAELSEDKNINNIVSSHSLAHFTHASYRALEEAANHCNDDMTADLASELGDENHQMADEAAEKIPAAVEQYIVQQTGDEENY